MPDAESVVRALFHLRESADTLPGAVLLEQFLTPGQYLVGVGLVPYVEDDLVLGRVIYIM